MQKPKNFKEQQNEATRGKKRYLERLAQTREADKELKEFINEDCPDGSNPAGSLRDRPFGS